MKLSTSLVTVRKKLSWFPHRWRHSKKLLEPKTQSSQNSGERQPELCENVPGMNPGIDNNKQMNCFHKKYIKLININIEAIENVKT